MSGAEHPPKPPTKVYVWQNLSNGWLWQTAGDGMCHRSLTSTKEGAMTAARAALDGNLEFIAARPPRGEGEPERRQVEVFVWHEKVGPAWWHWSAPALRQQGRDFQTEDSARNAARLALLNVGIEYPDMLWRDGPPVMEVCLYQHWAGIGWHWYCEALNAGSGIPERTQAEIAKAANDWMEREGHKLGTYMFVLREPIHLSEKNVTETVSAPEVSDTGPTQETAPDAPESVLDGIQRQTAPVTYAFDRYVELPILKRALDSYLATETTRLGELIAIAAGNTKVPAPMTLPDIRVAIDRLEAEKEAANDLLAKVEDALRAGDTSWLSAK